MRLNENTESRVPPCVILTKGGQAVGEDKTDRGGETGEQVIFAVSLRKYFGAERSDHCAGGESANEGERFLRRTLKQEITNNGGSG